MLLKLFWKMTGLKHSRSIKSRPHAYSLGLKLISYSICKNRKFEEIPCAPSAGATPRSIYPSGFACNLKTKKSPPPLRRAMKKSLRFRKIFLQVNMGS